MASDVNAPTLISIVGPTAIGKTNLALKLAERFNSEIISADSRQFYREMDIGTAKPSLAELSRIPHHFINSHSVQEDFTAGDFELQVLKLLDQLFEKQRPVILIGGSGLFVNAVLYGLDDLPKPKAGVRERLNQAHQEKGLPYLQQKLQSIDPEYYDEVDIQNPQRVIRAIEVFESTEIPYSIWRKNQKKPRSFRTLSIGLEMDRDALYERINKRVDNMMAAGLLEEVQSLTRFQHRPALQTVGYSELFAHLKGTYSLPEAVDKIKQNTRRYAKRQLTWFKRNMETRWFHPDELAEIILYIQENR